MHLQKVFGIKEIKLRKGIKTFEKSKKLTDKYIYEMLGVKISPGRVNCAMLSLNAFKNAVKDFEK